MKSAKLLVLVVFLMVLGGCSPKLLIKDGPMSEGEKPKDILVRPYQSLGLQVTPAILSGDVIVVEGPLPDKFIGAEYYPGRFRWDGWVVTADGREFFAQFVWIGMYRTGEYMFAIIIDGKKQELGPDPRILALSSVGEFVCDLSGNVYQSDRRQFDDSREYRTEIVRKYGSKIVGVRREITGFIETVKSWNRYQTAGGEIFSPYGENDFKRIARINPSYGLLEKIVAKGHITISTSPVAIVTSVVLAVIEGMQAPSEGWDYMSQLPDRGQMARIVAALGYPRLELIKQLNTKIADASTSIQTNEQKKE